MMMRLTLLAAAALACGDALNVAVTGATGRTGRLVVDRLLQQGHSVVAIVRDEAKAKEILSSQVKCATLDLATAKAEEMREACAGFRRCERADSQVGWRLESDETIPILEYERVLVFEAVTAESDAGFRGGHC